MTTIYTRKTCVRVKQPDGTYGGAVWALVGDGPDGCEAIAKMPDRPLKTAVTAPRDQGRHRYLMKLFAVAHKALPESWPAMSYDTFRAALMVNAGFYDTALVPDETYNVWKETKVPWSLEFSAMDDIRHKEVVDGVIKCLVSRWIPGLDNEAFEGEVLEELR